MKIVVRKLICLHLMLVLQGCASLQASGLNELSTDVCNINRNLSDSVGRVVGFRATFKTDGRHHAYLIDYECGNESNLIDVGNAVGNPQFDALSKAWNRQCASRGELGLCVVEQRVEVIGKIRVLERVPVVDIDRIRELEGTDG